MQLKHVSLIVAITDVAIITGLAALVCGLATMVSHVPGSSEFVLRWEPSRLVPAMIGWLIAVGTLGAFRYRAWHRSREALIAAMLKDSPADRS